MDEHNEQAKVQVCDVMRRKRWWNLCDTQHNPIDSDQKLPYLYFYYAGIQILTSFYRSFFKVTSRRNYFMILHNLLIYLTLGDLPCV